MPWSDWITPDPYQFGVTRKPTGLTAYSGILNGDGDVDVLPSIADSEDSVRAHTAIEGDVGGELETGGSFGVVYTAGKQNSSLLGEMWVAGVDMYAEAVTYDGSDHTTDIDWFPDPLGSLVEGVDYGVRPDRVEADTDAFVQYESSDDPDAVTADQVGWLDWVLTGLKHTLIDNITGETADWPASWSVRVANTSHVITTAEHYFPDYGDGDDLTSFTVTVDLTVENTGSFTDATDAWTETVPLSDIGATPTLTLIFQPEFLGTTDFPATDFAMPPSPEANIFWDYGSVVTIANIRGASPVNPVVTYQAPRFRYWIPETATGWHTVGGHYANIGAGTLRINTPGLGWLPLNDGS